MKTMLKKAKSGIRSYLQLAYTDERLAMLLAHAESGRLAYYSCCCFAGVPSATHALQKELSVLDDSEHPWNSDVEWMASRAFSRLGDNDAQRRRRLIPMIRAEMKRRERARQPSPTLELVTA